MKILKKAAAALLSAVLLCGCSSSEPSTPNINLSSPSAGEDCITPPFWVVEDDSTGAQIFLLGSMHAGKPGAGYPEYVLDALQNSSWVAPEMDTVAFGSDFLLQQQCVGYLMMNGTTMPELLGSDYDRTADYFRSKGLLQPGMDSMIPFYWASCASALVIEQAGLDSNYGTETVLLELAHSGGKEIREIEGGESQYKMMSNIPMSVQLQTLAECVGDENITVQAASSAELYDAWSSFDEEKLISLTAFDTSDMDSPEDWQAYYDLMYTDRQKVMSEFVIDSLKKGEHGFVFVGAMHYYAEPSILTQLSDAGYTVTPIRGDVREEYAAA